MASFTSVTMALQGGIMELFHGAEVYPPAVKEVQSKLERLMRDTDGAFIENKGAALAVHYRKCGDTDRAREEIINRLGELDLSRRFNMVEGKMVIELRPLLAIDKGTAVDDLIGDFSLQGAVYTGDDLSDIDAFRAMRRHGFPGIAVLGKEAPSEMARESDYTLNGVDEVARFLRWLAEVFPA
jgi:trehalose 6-phosphate phosphatase